MNLKSVKNSEKVLFIIDDMGEEVKDFVTTVIKLLN